MNVQDLENSSKPSGISRSSHDSHINIFDEIPENPNRHKVILLINFMD